MPYQKLSEVLSFAKLEDKLGDEWKWVLILDCYGVQGMIILY